MSELSYDRPFALQFSTNGARKFLLSTRTGMWRMISDTATPHFYEIITDLYMKRLYMDVEFLIDQNSSVNVNHLQTTIIDLVEEKVRAGTVIVLDSSSTVKASFHLIWPNFEKDSMQVLRQLVREISTHRSLQISRNFQQYSCIDTMPYTKNQNFRMLHCSKMGKKEILRVSFLTS